MPMLDWNSYRKQLVAGVGEIAKISHHNDYWPFYMVSLMFASAFCTLALSFWPYMIPFAVTIDAGAAPPSTLAFMFWGEGLWVFPLMLLYTAIGYRVFRGKLAAGPLLPHHQVLKLLRLWLARLRARRELRNLYQLDDRLLQDMGPTRTDIFRELSKSLWWRWSDEHLETGDRMRRG